MFQLKLTFGLCAQLRLMPDFYGIYELFKLTSPWFKAQCKIWVFKNSTRNRAYRICIDTGRTESCSITYGMPQGPQIPM